MTKDMTRGNPLKLILMFTVPVLLGNIFHQLYVMVDAIIVGRLLGSDAFAAVGAVTTVSFLIHGLVNGIAQGCGIAISHAFGAKDFKLLKHYVAVAMMMTVLVSFVVTVPALFLCESILHWINTPADIMQLAYDYIYVIFLGNFFSMAYHVAAVMLRGIGDSKTPLYFLVLSSVLNIFLDVFMIAVLDMGTAGAAWATVISQAVSAILCCVYMFSHFDILKTGRNDYYMDWESVKKMLSIGIPMSVNYTVMAAGMTVLQAAVNIYGSDVVAAFTAANKVCILAMQLPISLGTAMATYSGQNFGAGDFGRVFAGVRAAFLLNFALAAIDACACIFGGPYAVSLFIEAPSENIMACAMEYLFITSWFFVPLGWIFIYRNTLQGLGKAFMPMISGILEFMARYLTIAIFAGSFGYTAICFADPATWVSTALVLVVPYYLWEHKTKKELRN